MNPSLLAIVQEVLQEAFEGPKSNSSCFTNSRPNTGIFGTLDELTAEEASISIQGATMAAHADHTRYYLWVINTLLDGDEPKKDWEESWRIGEVDETRWKAIREDLEKEYDRALAKLKTLRTEDQFGLILGDLAHSAYHLGALRQMLKTIKG